VKRALVVACLGLAVVLAVLGLGQRRLAETTAPVGGAAAAATAPAESSAPTTTEAPRREVTMAFTGDLLPHGPVVERAGALAGGGGYDFDPMFSLVAPLLSAADLAICHLEAPLSPDDRDLSGYPTLNAPRELAEAARRAGYDGCSTASNHSWDRGRTGVVDTLAVLDQAGLQAAGTAASPQDDRPARYRRGGLAIAHLSYTYGLNGFEVPPDEGWLVDLIDVDQIAADARAARAGQADVVVVSLHWGTEYRSEPTADQVSIVDQLLPNDDIDLIVGHHAHVVQPVDRRAGKVVLYGLGNFLSNQSSSCCTAATQDGVIAVVTLTERDDGGFRTRLRYVPTWVDRSTFTIVPTAPPYRGAEAAVDESTLDASLQRTVDALSALGAPVRDWDGS